MNKSDFYYEVSREARCTQKMVRIVFEGMLEVMKRSFEKGDTIKFPGVFTVSVVEMPERVWDSGLKKNCYSPPHKRLKFRVSPKMRPLLYGEAEER